MAHRNPHRNPRRIVLFAAVAVVVSLAGHGLGSPVVAAATPRRAAAPSGWARPVPGAVTRAFSAPRTLYAAGAHRGVDLHAPGADVVAAGAGTVDYAGAVAGALHVVIRHDNGWRTSYSFLASLAVREGTRVSRGQVLGSCCREAPLARHGHGTDLHFGLRLGDDYVDPMRLFVAPDLAAIVHLAPTDQREFPSRRRSAIQTILDTTGLGALDEWRARLVGGSGALVDAFGDLLAAGAAQLPEVMRWLDSADFLFFDGGLAFDIAQGITDYLTQFGECDRHPPPLPVTPDLPTALMFVAGINSRTRRDGSSNGIDPQSLGYDPAATHWFSYADDGGAHVPSDTHVSIVDSARNLATQLRQLQASQPGRTVDLIAHSQGGVVVQAFLKLFYDSADPSIPPIGTVVTLSSPHSGAPSATSGAVLARIPGAGVALGAIELLPPVDTAAVRDLSELSDLQAILRTRPLPSEVDVYSIGSPLDWAVPQTSTRLDGARHVTTNPDGIANEHRDITTDPSAMRAVRNALLGRPAPCVGLRTAMLSAIVPERVAVIERVPGSLVRALGPR
jgi:hypothetical protein